MEIVIITDKKYSEQHWVEVLNNNYKWHENVESFVATPSHQALTEACGTLASKWN